ncbi:MAG: hypothetical protein ACKVPJ_10880 [Chitinophagales bacterium]
MKSKHALTFLFCGISVLFSCKKEFDETTSGGGGGSLRTESSISPDLEKLTKALALAHNDYYDTLSNGKLYNPVSNIIYRNSAKGVSRYYSISYEKLLDEAEVIGIPLDDLMNEKIRNLYSISDTSNIVRNIIADNMYNGQQHTFHLFVPFLDSVANVQPNPDSELLTISENKFANLNSKIPLFAYNYLSPDDYPLQGYKVINGSLQTANISSSIVINKPVFFSAFLLPFYTIYSLAGGIGSSSFYVYINDCSVTERQCQECPYVNTNVPLSNSAGGGGFDYELGINLTGDECYITTGSGDGISYAVVKAMPGFNYYLDNGCIPRRSIYKVDYPLYSINNPVPGGAFGNYLTLCQSINQFKTFGEGLGGAEYAIAPGGLYTLSAPGATGNPIYFAFPFGFKFWYSNGPDMDINYDMSYTGDFCTFFPELANITSGEFTNRNDFYANNTVDPLSNKYIASTDYTTISTYWLQDKLVAGFATSGGQMVQPENMWQFNAALGVVTPDPPADLGVQVGELVKWTGIAGCYSGSYTWYDIANKLFTGYEYDTGDELILHVYATFESGKKIDEYRYVTIGDIATTASEVRSFFTGKILEYYVKVYEKL